MLHQHTLETTYMSDMYKGTLARMSVSGRVTDGIIMRKEEKKQERGVLES